MPKPVAVTGMGVVSSIGLDVESNYNALVQQNHGISRIENLSTIHKNDIMVGEVKLTNNELALMVGEDPALNLSRTTLLGIAAAKQAIENAGIVGLNTHRTGLVSSTSVGGMDITERYFRRFEYEPDLLQYILRHDSGDSSHRIANSIGLKGLVTTISTACSSAANAIMLGARLIQAGELDRVIVGGTDALSKFTINGFKTLMILSDTYNTPFDQNRKGLNLGEAAAYLVLESDELVKKENKKVLAYVAGYGNANDAYHQTASSEDGEGAYLAMQKALQVSGLKLEEIDYINAHGTATVNNDLSEGRAILRTFGDNVPDFSSTKPFTGHTLAAAAGIEAVYSILALQNGVVFPNLNFQTPMSEFALKPQTVLKKKEIRNVVSNSFGFGGNCSSLIFSKGQ